ncbi:MAG: alpha/beta hydrolase [Erysipelotrichales bacterium]|nr:alpha/beta hydrolase [Erysipelotrichales bacterium]
MIKRTLQIYNMKEYKYPTKGGFIPTLTTYVHDDGVRDAILVVPGGSYAYVSPGEAELVAMKFYNAGFNAFVLAYTVNFNGTSLKLQPLKDISRAVRVLRNQSDNLNINPDRLTLCGFSAGGHLVGSLAVHHNIKELNDEYFSESNKPNKIILCYPVISSGEYKHEGTYTKLLGESPTEEELTMFSLEKQVNKDVPPVFIWHTRDDDVVPYENTILFKKACDEAGIPCRMYIFESGVHGLSTADEDWAQRRYGEPYTYEQIITEICYAISHNEQSSLPFPFNEVTTIEDIPELMGRWRGTTFNLKKKNDDVARWIDMAIEFMNEQ